MLPLHKHHYPTYQHVIYKTNYTIYYSSQVMKCQYSKKNIPNSVFVFQKPKAIGVANISIFVIIWTTYTTKEFKPAPACYHH